MVLRSEPVRVAPSFAELLRENAKARDMKVTELTRIADIFVPPEIDPRVILEGRKCLKK